MAGAGGGAETGEGPIAGEETDGEGGGGAERAGIVIEEAVRQDKLGGEGTGRRGMFNMVEVIEVVVGSAGLIVSG